VDRLLSALLLPLAVIAFVILLVVGIGESLLALARVMPELGGIKEPLSIAVALLLTVLILGVSTFVAGRGGDSHPESH